MCWNWSFVGIVWDYGIGCTICGCGHFLAATCRGLRAPLISAGGAQSIGDCPVVNVLADCLRLGIAQHGAHLSKQIAQTGDNSCLPHSFRGHLCLARSTCFPNVGGAGKPGANGRLGRLNAPRRLLASGTGWVFRDSSGNRAPSERLHPAPR